MVAQLAKLKPTEESVGARPVRIKRLDPFLIAVPLKQPMKMAGVTISHAENLLIRLEGSDGTVGWGEAASAPNMTGDTPRSLLAAAEIIRETVQGADLRFRPTVMERIGRTLYGNSGAKSAFELAMLDLIGRIYGISAVELLGGSRRAAVEPMWLIGNATVEQDVADAAARRREGFRSFKLKIASKTIEQDIEAAHQVRKALGPDARLCADANGGLTLEAARRFVTEAADAHIQFLEQPLPPHAIGGMAALQALGIMAIGADEGIHSVEDVEASAGRNAIAGLSLKLIKLGGASALLHTARRAHDLGLSINIAGKVAETSLASAATAQLACAVENVDWGISLSQVYLAEDIVKQPLAMADGLISPPDGPGLGVEVDEGAVRRFQTSTL
jgi:muconate cycloisomerase